MGARVAMDISVEVAPELWTIAQMHPMKSWPTQLVYSDSICNLLSLIDWTIENASGPRPPSPDPLSFREILEEMYPVTPSERVPFENFIAKAHADRARSARLTLAPR